MEKQGDIVQLEIIEGTEIEEREAHSRLVQKVKMEGMLVCLMGVMIAGVIMIITSFIILYLSPSVNKGAAASVVASFVVGISVGSVISIFSISKVIKAINDTKRTVKFLISEFKNRVFYEEILPVERKFKAKRLKALQNQQIADGILNIVSSSLAKMIKVDVSYIKKHMINCLDEEILFENLYKMQKDNFIPLFLKEVNNIRYEIIEANNKKLEEAKVITRNNMLSEARRKLASTVLPRNITQMIR